jgi:dGTPase
MQNKAVRYTCFSREEIERFEEEHLAPYAVKASQSLGRKYTEPEHPYRSVFQRDRDRIIHSSAFRRLQSKTQVFVYHEGDYYRTRLTHSLETAQIARTLARALRLNEDLCEALALAHDLGHPPFGHAGEREMNALMAKQGGFNHNMQALRIVEVLEDRYPAFPGLNLTWEVREGIVKHTLDLNHPETKLYRPELSPTLETAVVDKSDEIAYNNHDLDDAITSRMIELSDLKDLDLWQESYLKVKEKFPNASGRSLIHETIRTMINAQVTDLIENTLKNLEEKNISSLEAVRKEKSPLVVFSKGMLKKHNQLKDFLSKNVYQNYKVVQMTEKGKRVVRELFETFVKIPAQLPPHIQKKIGKESVERVVCDYIVGMTDKFALDEHKRLFDPHERFLSP